MKQIFYALLGSLSILSSHAQEEESQQQQASTVIRSSITRQGNRQVTIQKLVPPSREELQATAMLREVQPDREVPLPSTNEPLPSHSYVVSATVYGNQVSVVSWWSTNVGEEQKYTCFSNIDWNHLNGFHKFQGQGREFTFLLLQSSGSLEELRAAQEKGEIPVLPRGVNQLAGIGVGAARYMMIAGDENNDPAMDFIEAIHETYDAEKPALVLAQNQRDLEMQERRRQIQAERDNPKDVVIRYWRRDSNREENTTGR